MKKAKVKAPTGTPLKAFLPQRLSELSPDWSSRTYGGITCIWLNFICKRDWNAQAWGSGPTFAAAARAAIKDAEELLKRKRLDNRKRNL